MKIVVWCDGGNMKKNGCTKIDKEGKRERERAREKCVALFVVSSSTMQLLMIHGNSENYYKRIIIIK